MFLLWCGHRQSTCPNRARRGLLLDEQTGDDSEPLYDEEQSCNVEELVADSKILSMLRLSCLAHIVLSIPLPQQPISFKLYYQWQIFHFHH